MTLEYRALDGEIEATGKKLAGWAARYDTPARLDQFEEIIRRGAFRKSLRAQTQPIPLLVGHRPDRVVARTPRSLRLSDAGEGVEFEADLPDTAEARDLRTLIDAGVLDGMSVGFRVTDEEWKGNTRQVRAADLFEISVVAVPAYPDATVALRHRPRPTDLSVYRYRLRMYALSGESRCPHV